MAAKMDTSIQCFKKFQIGNYCIWVNHNSCKDKSWVYDKYYYHLYRIEYNPRK